MNITNREPAFTAILSGFQWRSTSIYTENISQRVPSPLPKGFASSSMGATGLVDLLMRKKVPLARLFTTYRAPGTQCLAQPTRLRWHAARGDRSPPASDAHRTPHPTKPASSSYSRRRPRTLEDDTSTVAIERTGSSFLQRLGLLVAGGERSTITVITFYKEQRRLRSAASHSRFCAGQKDGYSDDPHHKDYTI
ncbi:hypothetical protein GCK32_003615 [Trichostrongylus colubriformis]|uniref:Uncharacterized protein n=1 Tax=Trichostrongylus colubriformis TaxID=6319 RepID=A0AAN8J1E9_TRICO